MLKFYIDMVFKNKMSKLLFLVLLPVSISRNKSHFDASTSFTLLQHSLT